MVIDRIKENLAWWFQARDIKPLSVFLVGGAVRDLLLKRPCGDLDLACRNADEFARRLADSCSASLVRFEKKTGEACYRVVDRANPDNFLDLVELRDGDISIDLARRDFTINAMAMPVYGGGRLGDLVDIHSGFADLKGKIVRMVSPEAFTADPLRILRAWRFAAELGYRIDATTRKHLAVQAQSLKTVAVERIVYELLRILSVGNAGKFFRDMDKLGILDSLFAGKDHPTQSDPQSAVWDSAIAVMDSCDTILRSVTADFEETGLRVADYFRDGNRLPLLKLTAFYYDIGRPDAGLVEQMADRVARRLKLSNRDRSFFQSVLTGLSGVFAIAAGGHRRSQLIDFFKARADTGVGSIVLGLAILAADTVQVPSGIDRQLGSQRLGKAILDYYAGIQTELGQKDLIGGRDLIDMGMSPGQKLGAVLGEVRHAQDHGRVTSREEALEWVRKRLSQ